MTLLVQSQALLYPAPGLLQTNGRWTLNVIGT